MGCKKQTSQSQSPTFRGPLSGSILGKSSPLKGEIVSVPLKGEIVSVPFLGSKRRFVRNVLRFINSSHDVCTGTSEGAVFCFLDLRKLGHFLGRKLKQRLGPLG